MEIIAADLVELEKLGREFDTINLILNILIFIICIYLLWRVKQANGYHRDMIISKCDITHTQKVNKKKH